MILIPVILAGGSGTRLWPLSRKNFPKQFLRLHAATSLLQQTMSRAVQLTCSEQVIVSNEAHYFLCQEQLESFASNKTYLLEPCAKNTAPAIASAAHYIATHHGRDAVMLVLPSDHWIGDDTAWSAAMSLGATYAAKHDAIVTFGIQPTSPKTGYGYIESGQQQTNDVFSVAQFREKPDIQTATDFVNQGRFYWNSGMFVFRAGVLLDELHHHAPDIFSASHAALTHAALHHDYIRLHQPSFEACRSESIDYALMEQTDKAVMIPIAMPWSDLGCWTAVAEANQVDENGNTLQGNVIAKDSHDCLISSEETLVTTLGIRDQIIVVTADAVLVADKRYSQQVKAIVSSLGPEQGDVPNNHLRVPRPWGYYQILAETPTYKVKRLMIKPGAKISLQLHAHRAEHWVIVSGEADIINGEQFLHLSVNQSTYIPPQTRHRLSNTGTQPLYVIEVQSGDYLGEDDIVRFDDIYQRPLCVQEKN